MNFFNPNSKVTSHLNSFGGSVTISDSLTSKEALAVMEAKQISNEAKRRQAIIDKNYERQQIQNKIIENSLTENKIHNASQKLIESGKALLFKDIMTTIVIEALNVDDDFKPSIENAVYETVSSYIDERGGYNLLLEACKKSKSKLLKKVKETCEKSARKTTMRHVTEENETIDFSMNEEEEKEYNYNKSELNLEELSKLVKEKVLTVVLDEKRREQNEKDIVSQLEEESLEGEDIDDTKKRLSVNKSSVEEGTLFNALLRDSYQQLMETSEELTINMDNVLLEAITKYTILETFYTMQLENFSRDEIASMTRKMLNKR